jgi:hypothetical protein
MKASKPSKLTDEKENGQHGPDAEDRVVTQVPGIDSSQVIPSQPYWVKETSSKLQKNRPYTDFEKMG